MSGVQSFNLLRSNILTLLRATCKNKWMQVARPSHKCGLKQSLQPQKTLAQVASHKKLAPKLVPWANLNMFFLRSMILSRPSGNHILREKVFFIRKVLSKLRLCNLRERELPFTFIFCMTLTCDSFAYLLCGLSGHVRAPQMLPLIFLNHALKAGSNCPICVQHSVPHIFTVFTLFVSSAGKGTQCHQSGTSHLHQWPRSKTASAERK